MKSLEFRLKFLEKMVFWVERGVEEAKWVFEKNVTVWPLKTENLLISWDGYSRNAHELLAKCLKCTGLVLQEAFSREGVVRESWNSLCKILEEMKISFPIFTARLREFLLTTYSQKCLWKSFSTKQIWLFGKTLKTQVINKNSFKNK